MIGNVEEANSFTSLANSLGECNTVLLIRRSSSRDINNGNLLESRSKILYKSFVKTLVSPSHETCHDDTLSLTCVGSDETINLRRVGVPNFGALIKQPDKLLGSPAGYD